MERSKFGCFYNPRPSPGRCIKDPRSDVVESKCEIVDNRCRLKLDDVVKSVEKDLEKLSLVPTPKTAERATPKKLTTDTNTKLSGPISAYSIEYQDKKYYLFGDAHFSMSDTCPPPCKAIDGNFNPVNPPGSENCITLERLLVDIFNKESVTDRFVDLYLEIPFSSKQSIIPSRLQVLEKVEQLGMLYLLYGLFHDCFHKRGCKWDNVRFHYSDTRLQYNVFNTSEYSSYMKNEPPRSGFSTTDMTFEGYLLDRIIKSIELLGRNMSMGLRKKDVYIENTDRIVKSMYYSGGRTMRGVVEPLNLQLFKHYYLSDNFTEDVSKSAEPLLEELPMIKSELLSVLIPSKLLVNRRNKNMHRVRAQLEALEREGKGDLVNKITDFITEQYKSKIDNRSVMVLWDKLMKLYNKFKKPTSRMFGDEYNELEQLEKEYTKLRKILTQSITSNALLMDAYILARMFRTFPGTNHIPSDTNIIYAGAAHTQIYNDFFQKVLGADVYEYGEYDIEEIIRKKMVNRCIDIDINKFS